MDIYQIKRSREPIMISGYFGEVMPCDGCNVKIYKDIFLTIIRYIDDYRKIEQKYCSDCAIREHIKKIQEIKDIWLQTEKEQKKSTEEPLQCIRCNRQESDCVEKFKIHHGEVYCVDCLVIANKVIQDERAKEAKIKAEKEEKARRDSYYNRR